MLLIELTSSKTEVKAYQLDLQRATMHSVDEFKEEMEAQIAINKKIVLDISKCSFVDSVFLGALVIFLKKLLSQGGELKLVGLQRIVRDMFELTRMSKIFGLYDSVEEAVSSF